MNNSLVFMALAGGVASYANDYSGLTEEERENLKFMDSCIFGDNEVIRNASFDVMIMILKIESDIDSYTAEMVQEMKDDIYKNLTNYEKEIMDKFTYSCINSLGVCSETRKKEREQEKKLIKRRDEK